MADELIPLRESEPIFDAGGRGTRRFNRYIDDLTRKVNVTSSETEEINTQLSQSQQTISKLTEIIKKQDIIVFVSSDYTLKPYETAICSNSSLIDVTLPQNPIKGDVVNIKRKSYPINVIGMIDGKTNKRINIKYYSMKLIYDGSEWSEI